VSGRIHQLIDQVIQVRTHGNPSMQHFVRVQLLLQGIDPTKFSPQSPDDPAIEAKLQEMLKSLT